MSAPEWFDLSGRVAVVTGARRGIGRGLAKGLAHAGADLVVVSRTAAEDLAAASDYVHGHLLAVDGGWLAR